MSARPVPPLEPTRPLKLPRTVERRLDNGVRVMAVRRPSVPLVEVRLRIPFARAHLARAAVLTQTVLSGTAELTGVEIAAELQRVGGALSAGADPDRLLVSGNALVDGLDRLLDILGGVLRGATFPVEEVRTERSRLADRIRVVQSQPAHLARAALLRRMYRGHPYAVQTPTPEQVGAVSPAALRSLHAERVRPDGAILVIVGDLPEQKAIDAAQRALGDWTGAAAGVELPATPPVKPGPVVLVDRPGAVQSSLRLALPAVPRLHPDHAALQLANLLFGGYFSSRWVENIRESKGYTYGPHSSVEHTIAGSAVFVSAEVATEVTAPALLETMYEMGRLASLPPSQEELAQARTYALGTLQLGISTQSGLAGLAANYAGFGLSLDYLRDHAARLASASLDDVAAAAARYLAPTKALTVVLGDADTIESPLAALTPLRRVEGEGA